MVCLNWEHLDEKWKKIVKFSIISFVVLFSYIFLFAVDADDNAFLITGGAIGFVSSVCMSSGLLLFSHCSDFHLLCFCFSVHSCAKLFVKMGQQRRRLAATNLLAVLESSL